MGNAGNKPLVDLDKALTKEDLAKAWYAAKERGYIHLDQALRLTLLMAYGEVQSYEKAARKFLQRFIREVNPRLDQIKTVAEALEEIGASSFSGEIHARPAMLDLAKQLRERRP